MRQPKEKPRRPGRRRSIHLRRSPFRAYASPPTELPSSPRPDDQSLKSIDTGRLCGDGAKLCALNAYPNRKICLLNFLPELFGFRYNEVRPQRARNGEIARLVVLISGRNPTFDYYIAPLLGDMLQLIINMKRLGERETVAITRSGDYVLAYRYISFQWARHPGQATHLAGFGFFFDDDYAAFIADRSVPMPYCLDVARPAALPLRNVGRAITDVFVSTDVLQKRFWRAKARISHPIPGAEDLQALPREHDRPLRIVFHAQLSHLVDHAHAATILQGVSEGGCNVVIEVIGPERARGIWAGIPCVDFRAEFGWPAYRVHTQQMGADLLDAPMRDTPLNQARAATTAVDAVRMGAAAMLPDLPPYRGLAGSAFLIGGGPEARQDAIRALIADSAARAASAARLRSEVSSWRDAPQPPVAFP